MTGRCPAAKHDYSAYSRGLCRCKKGREAKRIRVAEQRAARIARPYGHGQTAMYDAGCRCRRCKKARAERYARNERTAP